MSKHIFDNVRHLWHPTVRNKPQVIAGSIHLGGKSGLDPIEWLELLIQNTEGKVQFDPNCRLETEPQVDEMCDGIEGLESMGTFEG